MTTVERARALWRGPAEQPVWIRPAVAVLLVGTGLLYLWNLGASGYANDFYAAAVQAGTQSWKAMFFGALDPQSFITVDKPPAALWIMSLSGRIFGFSSWSMLVPQALEGVAAVALLYAAVKRWFGPVAGLLSGAVFALTPVAVLMFKFNNPDALLVLLLVASGYCVVRAVENGKTYWLLLAGTAIGFGFLTKMLQAFLVVPAFALVYLVAAPTGFWKRIWQLLAAGGAIVVAAGWWLLIVALVPASQRPYIGGSTNNTPLELAFGYNGLERIFGGEGRGPGGAGAGAGAIPPQVAQEFARAAGGQGAPGGFGGGGGGFGGAAGITRMFGADFGTQVSWLIPAAVIGLLVVLWLTRTAPRTDRTRAGLLLWGGWMLVTGLTFSFMQGIIHPYYTIALAPGIAATVGIAVPYLWKRREEWTSRIVLAVMAVTTGVWAFVLLNRTTWFPPLSYIAAAAGILAAVVLLIGVTRWRGLLIGGIAFALITAFAGSAAYAGQTAVTAHTGATPTAGPGGSGGFGGGGRFAGPPGTQAGGAPAPTGGAPTQTGGAPGRSGAGAAPTGGVQIFGPRGGETANAALVKLLQASKTRWSAATMGSNEAAPLELNSKTAVMAIGGFSGSDPAPTLAQFQQYVAQGEVHYFVPGNRGGGMTRPAGATGSTPAAGATAAAPGGGFGDRGNSAISTWVSSHFKAVTVGGETIYDLTQPVAG